MHVAQDRNQ